MPDLGELEAVDRVEVVRIDLEGVLPWSDWTSVPGRTLGVVEGSAAATLASQIVALPEGEQMRCFVPRYGVRIWRSSDLLAEVALCFRCHNAITFVGGREGWFQFDAESDAGRELLSTLQRFDPEGGDG